MTDAALPLPAAERRRLVRRAQLLAWSSLAWMTIEGVVAVVAGVLAGSIALIGFGIDSAIEGMGRDRHLASGQPRCRTGGRSARGWSPSASCLRLTWGSRRYALSSNVLSPT
jgi:hypothetical protein